MSVATSLAQVARADYKPALQEGVAHGLGRGGGGDEMFIDGQNVTTGCRVTINGKKWMCRFIETKGHRNMGQKSLRLNVNF
jgi:hypothetical protein